MLTETFKTSEAAFFPIRELVQRTGVNASTLRAWENRHNLLNPVRTESGHRLYGQADVQRVRRVQELLVQGLSLNEIAPMLDAWVEWLAQRTAGATPETQRSAALGIVARVDGLLLVRVTLGADAADEAARALGIA